MRSQEREEQRNDFGFGSVKVIGDSDKNSLIGMVGMGTQLGQKRIREEEMETATWTSPMKSFHVKERKACGS